MAEYIWIVEVLAEDDSYILQACKSEEEATGVVARCLQFDVDNGLEYETADDEQFFEEPEDGEIDADGDGDVVNLDVQMQEYEGEGCQSIYRIRKLEIGKFYGFHTATNV